MSDFPKIDRVDPVMGGAISIPLCKHCCQTADSWAHDDENDEGHDFEEMPPAKDGGVYTLVDSGNARRPWKVTVKPGSRKK